MTAASATECHHEHVTQQVFLDYKYPSVHGPRTEVWQVKCNDCGEEFKEDFIGD